MARGWKKFAVFMKKVELSWEWFERSAQAMAQRCKGRLGGDGKGADGLIVLGRGGMTLGCRLSHLLNIPLAGAVIMSRYKTPTAETTEPPVDGVVISPYVLSRGGPVLLVDNIISEGMTLKLALQALEKAGLSRSRVLACALLARGEHPGIIGARVPDTDAWYEFPWEVRPGDAPP